MELIYCDESLLAVNKPAGLLAVPGRGADKQDSLSSRIQQKFPDALTVHRLDMATSGLMIFARGAAMQRRLSQMFREREIRKRYLAVVAGSMQQRAGEINLPIMADWPNRPLRRIDVVLGKASLTRYRVREKEEAVCQPPHTISPGQNRNEQSLQTSRVELEPVTGRTHQLRVHLAAIGHPILGDMLYGGATCRSSERLLLHAWTLNLVHPLSGMPLDLICEPPF